MRSKHVAFSGHSGEYTVCVPVCGCHGLDLPNTAWVGPSGHSVYTQVWKLHCNRSIPDSQAKTSNEKSALHLYAPPNEDFERPDKHFRCHTHTYPHSVYVTRPKSRTLASHHASTGVARPRRWFLPGRAGRVFPSPLRSGHWPCTDGYAIQRVHVASDHLQHLRKDPHT